MQKNRESRGSLIAGATALTVGFVLVAAVLVAQGRVVNSVDGYVVFENPALFFGSIVVSLFCVLCGGFLVGKYTEKR